MALSCKTRGATTRTGSGWPGVQTLTIPAVHIVEQFLRGHAQEDGAAQTRMAGHNFAGIDVRLLNPGGLTGVWAEENARASIWDAMYRKETFGVSGPHIKVRLFGGWGHTSADLNSKDWVRRSYERGVPMGGDLPPATKGKSPWFAQLGSGNSQHTFHPSPYRAAGKRVSDGNPFFCSVG